MKDSGREWESSTVWSGEKSAWGVGWVGEWVVEEDE